MYLERVFFCTGKLVSRAETEDWVMAPCACPSAGKEAHRLGGSSFPKTHGTKPLADLLSQEQPEQAEAVNTALGLIRKHELHSKRALEERLQREKEIATEVSNYSTDNTSAILGWSRTLRDLGSWATLPGFCQSCNLMFDGEELCGQADDSCNVAALAESWKKRHLAIPRPPVQKLKGLTESKCWIEGFCHCSKRRNREGYLAGIMWQKARKALRETFRDREDLNLLINGAVILLWVGSSDTNAIVHVNPSYVALQYLRPWRPTLVRLEVNLESELQLQKIVSSQQARRSASDLQDADMITFRVQVDSKRKPRIDTALQFVNSLDKTLHWAIAIMYLSTRSRPFPSSAARVRAWLSQPPKPVWGGVTDVDRASSMPEPLDSDGGESDGFEAGDKGRSGVDLEENVLELWGIQPGVSGSDSSSSSSSTDSGTCTTKGNTAVKTASDKSLKSSQARSSSSSSSSSKAKKDSPETKIETTSQPGALFGLKREASSALSGQIKRDRSSTIRWGKHEIVPRYSEGSLSALQLTCRCDGHVKCSKELSIRVAGSELDCRQLLKSWAMLEGLPSRDVHMSGEVKRACRHLDDRRDPRCTRFPKQR